jgi:hypothetical protein
VKTPRSTLLLAALVAVVLSGCGAARPAAAPFQTRANAICARINTSPFLDTKALYDADLRKTRLGLQQLSSLGKSAPNGREFGDLVGSMRAIYAFDRLHESEEVALAQASRRVDARVLKGRRPRWGRATRRFVSLVSRQIGGDEDEKFRDARALGLTACAEQATVGRVRESGSG